MPNIQRLEDWECAIGESKSAKFTRLATPRVAKALLAISQIANLANPHTYEYSRQQVHKIISDLHDEVDRLDDAFRMGKPEAAKLHYKL